MAGVALSVISAISAGNKKIVSSVRDKNNSHGDWRKDFYNGRNGNKTETTNEREQSYTCINSVERGGGRLSQKRKISVI